VAYCLIPNHFLSTCPKCWFAARRTGNKSEMVK
jgi:hypothetical protein